MKRLSLLGIGVGDLVLCPSGRLARIKAVVGDKLDAEYLRGPDGQRQTILNPRHLVKVTQDDSVEH